MTNVFKSFSKISQFLPTSKDTLNLLISKGIYSIPSPSILSKSTFAEHHQGIGHYIPRKMVMRNNEVKLLGHTGMEVKYIILNHSGLEIAWLQSRSRLVITDLAPNFNRPLQNTETTVNSMN